MKLLLNPEFDLYEKDGQAFCDSLQIAETFKKDHYEILKTIEGENRNKKHINGLIDNLVESGSRVNTRQYFILDSYKDSSGKKNKRYLLSRDGFTLLVMGFTGKKALRFKIEYINRFNQMEEFIKSLLTTKMEFPAFTNAIMEAHQEPKHYHFSNEINMINKIVLGVTAAKYKELNGIDKKVNSIRPYLAAGQIRMVEELQRIDIGLIVANIEYGQRKAILISSYNKMQLKLSA